MYDNHKHIQSHTIPQGPQCSVLTNILKAMCLLKSLGIMDCSTLLESIALTLSSVTFFLF
jgi:hypothetical protein